MATDNVTVKLRCHYEVLGVERDADISTIKKAHRKLALKWHPDKNIGDDSAQQVFLEIQQAYECLNDPNERKWYDDHRDAILKGWSATGGVGGSGGNKDQVDILFDVMPYMFAGCFRGYNDDATGFYAIYRNVFQQVYEGERDGCDEATKTEVDYLNVSFGASNSAWDAVVAFYQAWESFSSILNYAWADQWNVQEAEQRRVRRAMDEDNKRARRKARHSRNDEISALVQFVKKRDARVISHKERVESEKAAKEKELKEVAAARKKEKEKAMEEWREQAERELEAVEEEDRLQGRIRLADLEDDYDYGGGKKRGKGKKKKGTSASIPIASEENGDNVEDQAAEATQPLESTADEVDSGAADDGAQATATATEPLSAPKEARAPVNDWSCECCHQVFSNQTEMLNHLKSKSHKDAAALWKLEKKEEMNEGSDKKQTSKKKRNKKHNDVDAVPTMEDGPNEPPVEAIGPAATVDDVAGDAKRPLGRNPEPISDEDEDEDEVKPDFWRCQCCQKDFQSEGQFVNHLQSKKHKAVFKAYDKVLGKKLLQEVIEELHEDGKAAAATD